MKTMIVREKAYKNTMLSPGAVLMDGLIITRVYNLKKNYVEMSRSDMVQILPMSTRQISRYVAELVGAGLLRVEPKAAGANIYYPLGAPFEENEEERASA